MKLEYDPEVDVLVIRLREGQCAESDEATEGLIIDFDAEGTPLAIEILDARRVLSPDSDKKLELPFQFSFG